MKNTSEITKNIKEIKHIILCQPFREGGFWLIQDINILFEIVNKLKNIWKLIYNEYVSRCAGDEGARRRR